MNSSSAPLFTASMTDAEALVARRKINDADRAVRNAISATIAGQPKIRKGDVAYLVDVGHSTDSNGIVTGRVWATKITITSMGSRQGTALRGEDNLKLQLYPHYWIVRTEAEVRGIAADYASHVVKSHLAGMIQCGTSWREHYGHAASADARQRNAADIARWVEQINSDHFFYSVKFR